MAGYLASYHELSRRDRREEIERLMREELDELWSHRAVVACSDGMPSPDLELTHFTLDEPVAWEGGLLLQFTYHLGHSAPYPDVIDEIRGSGLASIDDEARVRLDDIEAERYRLVADETTAIHAEHDD